MNTEEQRLLMGRVRNGFVLNTFTVPIKQDWNHGALKLAQKRMQHKCQWAQSIHHHRQHEVQQVVSSKDLNRILEYLKRKRWVKPNGDISRFRAMAEKTMKGSFTLWDFDLLELAATCNDKQHQAVPESH
jgi:hypothetical protein